MLYFLLGFLLCGPTISAQKANDDFKKANELYSKSNYSEAAALYENILLTGHEASSVYYNLGNAYFKQNKLPQAILNYERAKLLSPSDEDIRFNISVANSRIIDRIDEMPEIFYSAWLRQLQQLCSADGWAWVSIFSLGFLGFSLLANLFVGESKVGGLLKPISYVSVIIFFLSVYMGNSQLNERKEANYAIIFTPTINVKSSPVSNGTAIFVVHEGTKVRLEDRVGEWVKIRLADGNQGWIEEQHLMVI